MVCTHHRNSVKPFFIAKQDRIKAKVVYRFLVVNRVLIISETADNDKKGIGARRGFLILEE
jgi:hypothetical protein